VIGEIMGTITTFRDLEVYKKLCEFHLDIYKLSMDFPKFELYELGSQTRRSSNSVPANLAEGWNNRHTNIYLESINRAIGELHETEHHLYIAYRKGYISEGKFNDLTDRYIECEKMLNGLYSSVMRTKRTPNI
jgi:four helix bundle protein